MGELGSYCVIESVVEYVDDPLKIGRIQASIPGVIHHAPGQTEEKEALPWIRPFKMYCYQTFTKPLQGQKVWVLINKSNYNEFWWFPYAENIDIVQGYLNQYYEETPDVFHAREEFVSPVMATWDNKQGYKWVIGEDYIDFFPTREFKLKVNTCNINVTPGDTIQVGGDNSSAGDYEPAVMGNKCLQLRKNLQSKCEAAARAAFEQADKTGHLYRPLEDLANAFVEGNILCAKCHVN
jgi:hypothetical protein